MKRLVAMSFLLSCILLSGGCQGGDFKDKMIVSPPSGGGEVINFQRKTRPLAGWMKAALT